MKKFLNIIAIVVMFLSLSFVVYSSFVFIKAKQNQELPNVFGYHLLFVETGSMEPTLPIGSIIIVKKNSFDSVIVGDIITFETVIRQGNIDYNVLVTHRVEEVIQGANKSFITKGDANEGSDFEPVTIDNYIGKTVIKITFLTFLKDFLSNTNIILLLVVIVVATFVIVEGLQLIRIFVRYQYEKETLNSEQNEQSNQNNNK